MATKSFIKRFISSPLVQAFLIYVSGGWIVLELTDYIINKYGLDEKISDILPLILLVGLPVAIFLAWFLSREKEEGTERGRSVYRKEITGHFQSPSEETMVLNTGCSRTHFTYNIRNKTYTQTG